MLVLAVMCTPSHAEKMYSVPVIIHITPAVMSVTVPYTVVNVYDIKVINRSNAAVTLQKQNSIVIVSWTTEEEKGVSE